MTSDDFGLRIDRGDDLQGVTKGTAIMYDARVEDIGSEKSNQNIYLIILWLLKHFWMT